jgi:hypothetical protein
MKNELAYWMMSHAGSAGHWNKETRNEVKDYTDRERERERERESDTQKTSLSVSLSSAKAFSSLFSVFSLLFAWGGCSLTFWTKLSSFCLLSRPLLPFFLAVSLLYSSFLSLRCCFAGMVGFSQRFHICCRSLLSQEFSFLFQLIFFVPSYGFPFRLSLYMKLT